MKVPFAMKAATVSGMTEEFPEYFEAGNLWHTHQFMTYWQYLV